RWDSSRHLEAFVPAPQTAPTELRRRNAEVVRDSIQAGGPARASQSEIWQAVDSRSTRLGVNSPTGALNDIYEQHREPLGSFADAVTLREGQSGALVAIGGRIVVLDWVSRPEVFASLHPALVQGYALDALESDDAKAPSREDAEALISILS